MKVGLYSRSLPGGDRLAPTAVLERVRGLGLDGCLFPSPLDLSRGLDPGELREVRAHADRLGLSLELGLGRINPYHFDASPDLLALGEGDFRLGLERLMRAARAIDCVELFFMAGTIADRFSRAVPWAAQLEALGAFLTALAPLLRDLGIHLNLKTHEEITTFEVVRLVESVGPDVLGVAFDPVNVLVRIEDPLAATRRVAPYVRQLHVDDAIVYFDSAGLVRKLRPCRDGVVDWPTVLELLRPDLRLTVELHRGQFRMPIFDPDWLAAQPDLTVGELAAVVRLAAACDERIRRGEIADPEADQADPSERLGPTVAYLRSLAGAAPGGPR